MFNQSANETSLDKDFQSRRESSRRNHDICVSVIDGVTVPVENWSTGGVLLSCDERTYALGKVMDVALKFKINNDIVDVHALARVIRKSNGHVAMKFEQITSAAKNGFQRVIDDYTASEFANSQMH